MKDTYVRWVLMKKHSLSKTDLNCLNFNRNRWTGDNKIFQLQEISKSAKSMKCAVYDYETKKWKEYTRYSMARFIQSVLQEHENQNAPLGDVCG